jgi:CRP/FNR family transcriptional regulator
MGIGVQTVLLNTSSPNRAGDLIHLWTDYAPARQYGDRSDGLPAPVKFARPGTALLRSNAPPSVIGILDGTARIVSHSRNGRRRVLRILLPGDTFGLFVEDTAAYIPEAVTDVRCAVRPLRDVLRALSTNAHLSRHITRLAAREQSDIYERLEVLTCGNAETRLAWFLLKLMQRTGGQEGTPMPLHLGRGDIADHLGLSLETTSRMFTRFKRRGWISEQQSKKVTILQSKLLRGCACY